MGFSNIRERKIKDLILGWITKNGSVEKVLIECDGKEVPIKRNHLYDYDAEIVIEYHTFSKK